MRDTHVVEAVAGSWRLDANPRTIAPVYRGAPLARC
jgi:hypothetical protein